MANRRLLSMVSYTLALIAALALALWLARIPLLELVATRAMESAGLEHAAVRIRQFDTSRLVITSLDFTRATDTAASRVEANDISIDYRAARLLDGELDQISIDHLLLRHENTSTGATPAQPLDTAGLLHLSGTDWRALMPLNAATIDRIELEGEGFGPLAHTAHRLQIRKTATAIEARLEYLSAGSNSRLLSAALAGSTLSIDLGVTDKAEKPAMHATIITGTDEIDIQWQLLPMELKAWLTPFVQIADIGSGAAVNGALHLDLATTGRINATLDTETENYHLAGYKILRPVVSLAISANMDAPDRRIDILPGSLLRVAAVESNTLSIGNSVLNVQAGYTAPKDHWSVDGEATLARLPVSYTDYAFVLSDIQNRIHADANGVRLTTTLSPENLPGKARINMSHTFASASGSAVLSMPQAVDLDGKEAHLGQLLAAWPYPFDLASGKLQLSGNATWSGGALHKLHAAVRFADVGGHYNKLLFSGLNIQQQVDVLPAFKSPRSGELSLEYIDAGVAIENVSARIDIGSSVYGALPKLFVNGLIGHLFDGDFTADPFAYDLNTPANSLTLRAHGIDLAEVVATQQFGDLEVSGRLDGDLPLEINPFGVFINNGNLRNASPEGVIRYRPSAGTGGVEQNPLTGIALKALSDFHYDTLKARANYVPDGTLTLNFELKGTSPPLQTTRPVHLNINTEQNLLSLLKSIRYVDGLSQALDKNVRELYQRRAEH